MDRHRKIGATVLLAIGMAFYLAGCSNQMAFEQKVWLANPQLDVRDNPRSLMIDDVIRNHLKLGMTRHQVRTMLGQPDAQSEYEKENNIDVYGLGHIGSWGIDPSVLELYYDSTGRLVKIDEGET